jgi:MSHA type pilus biogenesis protein MshL
VVVYDVPVRELLFSLARDSNLNLDIDPDIATNITLNAVDQPLIPLLDRITDYSDLRYDLRGNLLRVSRDTPYLLNYHVDSLNMSRSSTGSVRTATQIEATGQGIGEGGGSGSEGGNGSGTSVSISSDYDFWGSLYGNLNNILSDGLAADTAAADADNPNIVMNRESGIIGIRATRRQHGDVQRFIDSVEHSTDKQVLIEATIAEVVLSDSYQAGIDWSYLSEEGTSGINLGQSLVDTALKAPPNFVFNVTNINGGDVLSATLTALETFGDVSVMSSPKVMAMNNQTAVLKVVDNLVYFTIQVNIESGDSLGEGRLTTYETDLHTVPVGIVMTVTPFIDDEDEVILNVRPTISRVIDYVQDPNPALAAEDVVSEIPVIQVREVESVLRISSGDVAVIGGLMQDKVQRNSNGIPILGTLPFIGSAFRYDDDASEKTELVIFIQPRVTNNASLEGELKDYQRYLPQTTQR